MYEIHIFEHEHQFVTAQRYVSLRVSTKGPSLLGVLCELRIELSGGALIRRLKPLRGML